MTERFKNAFDALTEAFFKGTLGKATCSACACGNIIAKAVGIDITKEYFSCWGQMQFEVKNAAWWKSRKYIMQVGFTPEAGREDEMNQAGYSVREFCDIENAFEGNTQIDHLDYDGRNEEEILEDQYRGLCAVVDVLIKLDEEKEELGKECKEKLSNHPKLKLVCP